MDEKRIIAVHVNKDSGKGNIVDTVWEVDSTDKSKRIEVTDEAILALVGLDQKDAVAAMKKLQYRMSHALSGDGESTHFFRSP